MHHVPHAMAGRASGMKPPAASPASFLTTKSSRLLGPRPPYGNPEWDHLAELVDRSRQLIAHAVDYNHVSSPMHLDERARSQAILELVEKAARVEARQRHLEHDYSSMP